MVLAAVLVVLVAFLLVVSLVVAVSAVVAVVAVAMLVLFQVGRRGTPWPAALPLWQAQQPSARFFGDEQDSIDSRITNQHCNVRSGPAVRTDQIAAAVGVAAQPNGGIGEPALGSSALRSPKVDGSISYI